MKQILFTFVMASLTLLGYGQLKIVSNGDLAIGNTTDAPGGIVDIRRDVGGVDLLMRMWNQGVGGSKLRYVSANSARAELQLTTLAEWLAGVSGTAANGLQFHVRTTGSANNEATLRSQVKMLIDRDGEIGIGTMTPSFQLHLSQNSAAKPGGGSWTDSGSDKRLKKDIKPFEDGLESILQINPVWYQFNNTLPGYDDGKSYVGLIAQEVQEIAPYMVSNFEFKEYQASGETEQDYKIEAVNRKQYLTLNNTAITYMLVNAVKEQQELIEDKEDRITELEERLLELENKVNDIVNQYDVNLGEGGGLTDAGFLGQNIPNPFDGETAIVYNIPEKSTTAEINIYDLTGRLIKSIQIDHKGKGQLNVTAYNLPSGTYSYQLVIDNDIIGVKKMVLTK